MKNYRQEGDIVALVAPYAVTAGQGALVGQIFGVATIDIASGISGEFAVCGVFDLTKQSSLAITQGARVFWDNVNRYVTTVATNNMPIGAATDAAGSSDTTVRVLLDEAQCLTAGAVAYRAVALTPTASLTTDYTLTLPAGHILAVYERTTTAYTGNTVTVSVGTTVGGGEIVAAVDIKAKASRTLTVVDANSDAYTPFAGGTVNIRITQTATATAVGAGQLIFLVAPTV